MNGPFARKTDKVAIVGFSDTSRHLAPYNDPEYEIWGLNEEYFYPWMSRFDRWFQLHPSWDFMREINQNHHNHPLWLQNKSGTCLKCNGKKTYKEVPKGDDLPCDECQGTGIYVPPPNRSGLIVYMQQAFNFIPNSVRFPLPELTKHFLSRIGRPYFTSSPAFMLALAMGMGYKTIGLYGFEMGTDTEYHYQRPCFEYWMGQADGRGINIIIPDGCNLNSGKLYGYENMLTGYRQDLEARKEFLEARIRVDRHTLAKAEGRMELMQRILGKNDWSDEELIALTKELQAEVRRAKSTVNYKEGEKFEIINTTKMYDLYFRHEVNGVKLTPDEVAKLVGVDVQIGVENVE